MQKEEPITTDKLSECEITARQRIFFGEKHCLSGKFKFVQNICPGENLVNWKPRLLKTVDYLYNVHIIPHMSVQNLSCPYIKVISHTVLKAVVQDTMEHDTLSNVCLTTASLLAFVGFL